MNTKSYLPSTDADRVIWLNNFSAKIGTYASVAGITPAEVTSVRNDAAFYSYIENMVESYKQVTKNVVGYKSQLKHAVAQEHIGVIPPLPTFGPAPTTVPEGIFDRVIKIVARIKSSLGYNNDTIGQDLGIVAPSSVFDITTLRPLLKVRLDAGRPLIKCAKNDTDGIDLYADRNDGTGFQLVGRLFKTEFIDTANLPTGTVLAEWSYKAMYVIGNDNVGLMSSVESVLVKRM
jgi:hypothetical protein